MTVSAPIPDSCDDSANCKLYHSCGWKTLRCWNRLADHHWSSAQRRIIVLQVVLSPHVYGPFVTSAPTAWAGPDLYARLTASFGYATQQGEQVSTLADRTAWLSWCLGGIRFRVCTANVSLASGLPLVTWAECRCRRGSLRQVLPSRSRRIRLVLLLGAVLPNAVATAAPAMPIGQLT